jgi:hypothetical protein
VFGVQCSANLYCPLNTDRMLPVPIRSQPKFNWSEVHNQKSDNASERGSIRGSRREREKGQPCCLVISGIAMI